MWPAQRLRAVVVPGLVIVALVTLVGGSSPAAAHGGAGEITLASADPVGPSELTMVVDVTFVSDGHAAEVGSLTVEGAGPDGARLDPVEPFRPTDVEGRYAGSVTFPGTGTWEVSITSTFPPGQLDTTVEVPDAAPGAEEPSAPTSVPPGGTDAGADDRGGDGAVDEAADQTADGGGSGAAPWAIGGVVAVLAAVAAVSVIRRRTT